MVNSVCLRHTNHTNCLAELLTQPSPTSNGGEKNGHHYVYVSKDNHVLGKWNAGSIGATSSSLGHVPLGIVSVELPFLE